MHSQRLHKGRCVKVALGQFVQLGIVSFTIIRAVGLNRIIVRLYVDKLC